MNIEKLYYCKEVIHMMIWEHKRSSSAILSLSEMLSQP